MTPGDHKPPHSDDLRRQLIELKAATLKAKAILMGLKLPEEDIAPAAHAKILQDVEGLSAEELAKQIEHWTGLHRSATNALASRPTPPANPSPQ